MKNTMKLFGIVLFIAAIAFPVMAQTTLSGTYTYTDPRGGGTLDAVFSGSNFTLLQNGATFASGTFRVSGNSVTLNNNPYFTIVDANTLRDTDNDLWIKSEGGTLSGTYTFRDSDGGTLDAVFSGNTMTLVLNGATVSSGTYRVSGSTVYVGSTPYYTIVDANTLRGSDGEIWRKQGAGATTQAGGTLTITNASSIPAGRFIMGDAVLNDGTVLYFAASPPIRTSWLGVSVGSTITINVYEVTDMDNWTMRPFTGSGTARIGIIDLYHLNVADYARSSGDVNFVNTAEITFTNGSATINFGTQMRRR